MPHKKHINSSSRTRGRKSDGLSKKEFKRRVTKKRSDLQENTDKAWNKNHSFVIWLGDESSRDRELQNSAAEDFSQ